MKFSFKAKSPAGELKEGVVDASNRKIAIQIIQKSGFSPFILNPVKKKAFSLELFFSKMYASVSSKDLVIFFRQLSILIEARVPIAVALTSIQEQTVNPYFKNALKKIVSDVENGMSFSDAMEKFKDIFSLHSINVIRSGETSGTLKKAVDHVSENIERNYNLTARVRGALLYPSVIIAVFIVVGFVVAAFIVPNLSKMIRDLNADVPWYTKVVMNAGDFMQTWWWAIMVFVVGMVIGIIYYTKTEKGERDLDKIKIYLPIIGGIYKGLYISRFGENLAVLLSGGIPIVQAIKTTSEVIGNSLYREVLLKAAEEVKNGGEMSLVLRQSTLFPPMVSQMVKIGEESGQIDSTLNHVSKFYESETERATQNLAVLIEPFLMVMIGLAVGFLAFAVLMPIYDIAGQM